MTNGPVTSNFRNAGAMVLDPRAGRCINGHFHRWGDRENRQLGLAIVRYDIPCTRCDRVRVLEYTKRGNHVAGYFTRRKP